MAKKKKEVEELNEHIPQDGAIIVGDKEFGESEKDANALLETDEKGNPYLPNVEEVAPVELVALIDLAKEIQLVDKPAFAQARDNLINQKDMLKEMAHKNIEHFKKNPNNENQLIYKFGKIEIKITQTEEKIDIKLEKDELED